MKKKRINCNIQKKVWNKIIMKIRSKMKNKII